MNTGNWKTATSGRDRKKHTNSQDKSKSVRRDASVTLARSSFDPTASNPFDVISGDCSIDDKKFDASIHQVNGSPLVVTQILKRGDWDAYCESTKDLPILNTDTEKVVAKQTEFVTKPQDAPARPQWGDQSDEDEPCIGIALDVFNEEYGSRCSTLKERLGFINRMTSMLLMRATDAIKDERFRVGDNKNEKSFVRNLHDICTLGRDLVTSTNTSVNAITCLTDAFEVEKNNALNELKSFLLGMTDLRSDECVIDAPNKIPGSDIKTKPSVVVTKRASDLVSQERGKYSTVVARSDPTSSKSTDMISVSLDINDSQRHIAANLTVPLARQKADMLPMSIKFASDLGVFLINLDGKTYSFCNGMFVSRPSKTGDSKLRGPGDNTLYGKRCNPGVARCVGAECTYYHDPLSHANGHTSRNMGVHYVVSELISGVSTDTDIIETAQGRNKYIVEDIVQLAGMLLIKAFLVKKAREDRSNRADNDA